MYLIYVQIYVVDSNNRLQLEETGLLIGRILSDRKLSKLPLLVYANKQDMLTAVGARELAEALNLHVMS